MSGGLEGVSAGAPVAPGAPIAPNGGAVAAPNASVLPQSPDRLNVDDAISLVMKMTADLSKTQANASKASIEAVKSLKQTLSDKRIKLIDDAIKAAAEAAKKAKEDDGGIFGDIMKELTENIGPLALVGFAVGGVFMVAADFVAHEAGLEDGKMDLADAGAMGLMLAGPIGYAVYAAEQCLKNFGPEEIQQTLDQGPTVDDQDVRKANQIALMLTQAQLAMAASLASGGLAAPGIVAAVGVGISTATQLAQETGALKLVFGEEAAKYIALGGTITGTAMSLGGSAASLFTGTAAANAPALLKAADKVKAGVTLIQSIHDINAGLEKLEAAELQHTADNLQIEAKKYGHMIKFFDRVLDDLIEDVRTQNESAQKANEICKTMNDIRGQTMLMATTGVMKG